jgi:hypothetical protein
MRLGYGANVAMRVCYLTPKFSCERPNQRAFKICFFTDAEKRSYTFINTRARLIQRSLDDWSGCTLLLLAPYQDSN